MSIQPIEMTVTLRNNLIKARRLQRGWSQRELASIAGVSVATIGRFERLGNRHPKPGNPNLMKIADVLNCNPEELIAPWMSEIRKSRVTKFIREEDLVSLTSLNGLPSQNPSPEQEALISELGVVLRTGLSQLPPQQQRCLRLIYGIDDGIERSAQDVAFLMGLSISRIHYLRAAAMYKLRHWRRVARPLREFVEL